MQVLCVFGGTIFLLDPTTLETLHELRAEGRSSMCYSHRRHLIVVGSASTPGSVVVFDSNDGVEIMRASLSDGVEDAGFSHDDRLVVCGGADRSVRVLDARTGQPMWKAFEHGGMVVRVEFAPGDNAILTASTDGSIRRFAFPSLHDLIVQARRVAGRELSDDERRSYGLDKRRLV
jgi:WD40 repeat protein